MKRLLTLISTAIILAVSLAMPHLAYAADPGTTDTAKSAVCSGVGLTANTVTGQCIEDPNKPTVNSIIKTIVNILSFLIGFIAVVMIIIGGLKYVTSNGDANSVNSAKNTILYAVLGLVVAASAQALVFFTIGRTNPTPTKDPTCAVGTPAEGCGK